MSGKNHEILSSMEIFKLPLQELTRASNGFHRIAAICSSFRHWSSSKTFLLSSKLHFIIDDHDLGVITPLSINSVRNSSLLIFYYKNLYRSR